MHILYHNIRISYIIYHISYCQCQNYRTEVEEYEGTVIYRTLLFYNYVFLGRYKKNVSEFTPNFFRRSIILVGALLFYNYVFPHLSHISHFRSIIHFSVIERKMNYRIIEPLPGSQKELSKLLILSSFYLHFLIKSSLNLHFILISSSNPI